MQTLSAAEYLLQLQRKIDTLKAIGRRPSYAYSQKEQDNVLLHFITRAIELGQACFSVSELNTPLCVLTRVLCEDLFTIFWVSLSEANAAEYAKQPISQMAKIVRINLQRGQARILNTETEEDATQGFSPELDNVILPGKKVEQMAIESGLGKVYDIVYRFASLSTHGNSFDLSSGPDWQVPTLSATVSILNAIVLIVENSNRTTRASDILRAM